MKLFPLALATSAVLVLAWRGTCTAGAPLKAAVAVKGRSPRAVFEARLPKAAPHKLSDIYKIFTEAVRLGLGADVGVSSVRVRGQSWELLRDAHFPEVELTLKPFETQGLRFEKAGFLFRQMAVDRTALWGWKLKALEMREVQSRMVFTLRSLAHRLGSPSRGEVRVEADMEGQQVELGGQGAFCGVACAVEARCHFVWDEKSKTLNLVAIEQRFGGHRIPRWLWSLADSPVPKAPVLDLGFSWIPFNIQEVHVGWDEVDLSTDW